MTFLRSDFIELSVNIRKTKLQPRLANVWSLPTVSFYICFFLKQTALELPQMVRFFQHCRQKNAECSHPVHPTKLVQPSPRNDVDLVKDSPKRSKNNKVIQTAELEYGQLEGSDQLPNGQMAYSDRDFTLDCESTQGLLESRFEEMYQLLSDIYCRRESTQFDSEFEAIFETIFGTIQVGLVLFILYFDENVSTKVPQLKRS